MSHKVLVTLTDQQYDLLIRISDAIERETGDRLSHSEVLQLALNDSWHSPKPEPARSMKEAAQRHGIIPAESSVPRDTYRTLGGRYASVVDEQAANLRFK